MVNIESWVKTLAKRVETNSADSLASNREQPCIKSTAEVRNVPGPVRGFLFNWFLIIYKGRRGGVKAKVKTSYCQV